LLKRFVQQAGLGKQGSENRARKTGLKKETGQ
jgi:hypothetical protein